MKRRAKHQPEQPAVHTPAQGQTAEAEQGLGTPAARPRAPRGRLRTVLLLAGCAVLMALLAAVPLGWFALSDAALLDRPAAMTQPYESVTPSGDDFYLIRQLRTQAELSPKSYAGDMTDANGTLYTQSGSYVYNMTSGYYGMQEYLESLLDEMEAAGVLDESWAAAAQTVLDNYGANVYYSNDTLGFTRISVFGENEECLLELIVENRTSKPVSVQIASDANLPVPDTTVLQAWVWYNELDGLDDWAAPEGTEFAESGLYSARGGVLMSMGVIGTRNYTTNTFEAPYRLYMLLSAWEMPAQAEPAPFQVGNLREASGNVVLIPTGYHGLSGLVCKRGEDNALHPLCGYPGCSHDGPACPAWVASYYDYAVAEWAGKVYLLYEGNYDDMRDYYANYKETEGYNTDVEEASAAGGEAAVQALDARIELRTQPARVEILDETYTTRSWLAECPDSYVTEWWQDDEAFYLLDVNHAQAAEAQYASQYRLVRVGFDGSVAFYTLPKEQEPVLVNGSRMLLRKKQSTIDMRGLFCLSGSSVAYSVDAQSETTYSLCDLATGEMEPVLTCQNVALSRIMPVALTENAFYYCQDRNWIGGEQHASGFYLWKLDLTTGKQTDLAGEELGNGMAWVSNGIQLANESGEEPRYALLNSLPEGDDTAYRKIVLDLQTDELSIVNDWFPEANYGGGMADDLHLCDGVLTAALYVSGPEGGGYYYPIPRYATIPWQDYLAGGDEWTFIDPWDGSPNPSGPEGIAALGLE